MKSPELLFKPLDASLFRNKKILLTGGTGMIGRWLMQSYLITMTHHEMQLNCELHVKSRDPKKFLKEYPVFDKSPLIQFHRVNEPESMPDDLTDVIYGSLDHTANLFSNLIGFFKDGIGKRFLLISSGVTQVRRPFDNYVMLKLKQEFLLDNSMKVGLMTGHNFMVARIYTVCGTYYPLDRELALSQFLKGALNDREVILRGTGDSIRSYLEGSDVASFLWTILAKGKNGHYYDVGSPDRVTIRSVAEKVACYFNVPLIQQKEGHVQSTAYAPSELGDTLRQLKLKVDLNSLQAIEKTCKWWKERKGI